METGGREKKKKEAQRRRGRADNRQTTKFGESCDVRRRVLSLKQRPGSPAEQSRDFELRHRTGRSINSYYNLVGRHRRFTGGEEGGGCLVCFISARALLMCWYFMHNPIFAQRREQSISVPPAQLYFLLPADEPTGRRTGNKSRQRVKKTTFVHFRRKKKMMIKLTWQFGVS